MSATQFFACLAGSLLYWTFKDVTAWEGAKRGIIITISMLMVWGICALASRIEILWKSRSSHSASGRTFHNKLPE